MTKSLDLLLITPPFIRPTSPPLGIASLKAFLDMKLPGTKTCCVDLNLDYYYLALEWLKSGKIKLRLYNWEPEETVERVVHSFDYLKSVVPSPQNLREYHGQATVFLSFENIFNSFTSEMALRSITGAPVPSGMSAFLDALMEPVLSLDSRLIGISVLFDVQMPMTLLLAKTISQRSDARVILGGAKFGVEPSFHRIFHEPVKQEVKGQAHECMPGDFIDGIIPGEGELALLHIMDKSNEGKFHQTPNLAFSRAGTVKFNPPGVIDDLDGLPPPDFSDFNLERYMCAEKILPVLTARGCPWGKCSFCTHHRSYKRYRQASVEKTVSDMEYLKDRYGVRFFNVFDEMIPPARFRNLARRLMKQGLDICYSAYGKPVKNFDCPTLKIIHDSGCRLILWGVESASQRVLDRMHKGTRVDEIKEVLRCASETGIKNLVFMMFGFAGETEEEFQQSLSFLESNKMFIHALSKGTFRLMEGSEIARNPQAFGITRIREKTVPPFKSRHLLFDMSESFGPEECENLFKKSLKRIESVGLTPRFGTYRDHLLLFACN